MSADAGSSNDERFSGRALPLAADAGEMADAEARSTGHPAQPVLDYRSPPHPPIPEFPKHGKVVRGRHVFLATLAGAAFFSCMDAHWMPLTAWTVSMACVYVLVRTGAERHLTATRRVQVILAAFLSFVATFGGGGHVLGPSTAVRIARATTGMPVVARAVGDIASLVLACPPESAAGQSPEPDGPEPE